MWVRKDCYDQRKKEQTMVFRHPYPHLAGLASLFSTSCACLLTALLLISCSSSTTGISNATSTGAAASPRSTPAAPTSISQATSTAITILAPVTTPPAPPPRD